MHHVGIMQSGEDVAARHVGSKLVDLFDTVDHIDHQGLIAQVADDEFVGGRSRILMKLEVYGTDPIAFAFNRLTKCPPMKPPAPFTRTLFIRIPFREER